MQVSTSTAAPKGATTSASDLRALQGETQDPFELERIGLAAVSANELDRARVFFERAWKIGELPTAAYNLACLDARKGRADAAFANLDKALAAGFDDGASLEKDPDLASLRTSPKWKPVVSSAAKNRAAGDAAVGEGGRLPHAEGEAARDPPPRARQAVGSVRREQPVRGRRASRTVSSSPRRAAPAARRRSASGGARRSAPRRRSTRPSTPPARRPGTRSSPSSSSASGGAARRSSRSPRRRRRRRSRLSGRSADPSIPARRRTRRVCGAARLFLGSSRDANPNEINATRRGVEALRQQGFQPVVVEWPGASEGFPSDVPRAVKETLDAFAGLLPAAR